MNIYVEFFNLGFCALLEFGSTANLSFAYIGPGTLTIVFQVIVGLMVGGIAGITAYRGKIKAWLSKRKKDD